MACIKQSDTEKKISTYTYVVLKEEMKCYYILKGLRLRQMLSGWVPGGSGYSITPF